jgi:hypothetical protein
MPRSRQPIVRNDITKNVIESFQGVACFTDIPMRPSMRFFISVFSLQRRRRSEGYRTSIINVH